MSSILYRASVVTLSLALVASGLAFLPTAAPLVGSPLEDRSQHLAATESLLAFGSGTTTWGNHADTTNGAGDLLGMGSGEPTLGVNWNVDGGTAALFQSGPRTMKVTFDDSVSPPTGVWESVTPPLAAPFNNDPVLYTDPGTGRTWAGGLVIANQVSPVTVVDNTGCSILSFTDDNGATWNPVADACSLPGWDHQSITAGPWSANGPLPDDVASDRAVYYCAQQAEKYCWVSHDGGTTFTPLPPPDPLLNCAQLFGKMRVAGDGTLYMPINHCPISTGPTSVMVSTDNGLTWSIRKVVAPGSGTGSFDPSVSPSLDTVPGGTSPRIYLGQAEANGAYIAVSDDRGLTWNTIGTGHGPATKYFNVFDAYNAGKATADKLKRAEFAQVIAGDLDRAAFAFLGSTSAVDAHDCADPSPVHEWHMYVAMTYDGGQTWEVTKATTDPVQRGGIQAIGGSTGCRNLLDFNDATMDLEGRVLVGYADGCVSATCKGPSGTPAQSNGKTATITRQASGRGLLAEYDVEEETQGIPLVTITTPTANQAVTSGTPFTVAGDVDRDGGSGNAAPTAGFSCTTSGLGLACTGSSTDADGAIAGWDWDWGDGSAHATTEDAGHTYATAGLKGVTLVVTDDLGATGSTSHSYTLSSGGGGNLPVVDDDLEGSLFAYNQGGVGISNVVATVTGLNGDPVPKYPGGTGVETSARSVVDAQDRIDENTASSAYLFKPDGAIVIGPVAGTGSVDNEDLLTGEPLDYSYGGVAMTMPLEEGRYYLAYSLTIGGTEHFIKDTNANDPSGLKPLDVIGAPAPGGDPAACATYWTTDVDSEAEAKAAEDCDAFLRSTTGGGEDCGLYSEGSDPMLCAPAGSAAAPLGLTRIATHSPSGPGAGGAGPGVRFFASSYIREGTDAVDCGKQYVYDTSAALPAAGKAYANLGLGALSCSVTFRGTTDSSAPAGSEVAVGLAWACDSDAPMMLSAGVPDGPSTSRFVVSLFDGTTKIGEARVTAADPADLVCGPAAHHDEATITTTADLAAGATFDLEITPFVVTGDNEKTALPNFHYIVGGAAASFLEFPQGAAAFVADAGGPYSGDVATPIAIAATSTGGSGGTPTCAWTGSGATFSPASSCATTVSFAADGNYLVSVAMTRGTETDSDQATVTVGDPPVGERVEVRDGSLVLASSAALDTDGTTTPAAWTTEVTLSGTGSRTLTAVWIDGDGSVLDQAPVTVSLGGVDPCDSDTAAPVISAVTATPTGTTMATISWSTNEASDGVVHYGTTPSYGNQALASGTTSHGASLTGLAPGTTYHFEVASADGCGHAADSEDGMFTTASEDVEDTEPFVTIESPADGAVLSSAALTVSGHAGSQVVQELDANGDGFVVIAVPDTGINPYHRDFWGNTYPRNTDSDPANNVDFRANPATYLDGFPAGIPALDLTIDGGFHLTQDTAKFNALPENSLRWIPGTKIIGAYDAGDAGTANGAADTLPLFDDEGDPTAIFTGGHGTASASVAAGNLYGSCKECLLVAVESFDGDEWAYQQDWIDIVTVSGGPVANVPDGSIGIFPETGKFFAPEGQQAAVERGMSLLYAGGNGNEGNFLTPGQTYLATTVGPGWNMRVGAVNNDPYPFQDGSYSIVQSNKPVDISSYGSGNIPAACNTDATSDCGHSGTSSATPITAGHLGELILRARELLGDTGRSGTHRDTALQAGVVASGTALDGNTYLDDGVFTRAEAWYILKQAASPLAESPIDFNHIITVGVGASPVDYAYAGYGVADDAAEARAIAMLEQGTAQLRDTADADDFFALDQAVRTQIWGGWDDDADTIGTGPAARPAFTLDDLGLDALDVAAQPDLLIDAFPLGQGSGMATASSSALVGDDPCDDQDGRVDLYLDGSATALGSADVGVGNEGRACSSDWTIDVLLPGLAYGTSHTLKAVYGAGAGLGYQELGQDEVDFIWRPVTALGLGQDHALVVEPGVDRLVTFTVPPGHALLSIGQTGPECVSEDPADPTAGCTPDIDLYVRHGAAPTVYEAATFTAADELLVPDTNDCSSASSGNDEACDLAQPAGGTWYVLLHPYAGSATVTLRSDLDLPDTDHDGTPDGRDTDRDGDGLDNDVEEFLLLDPDSPSLPTPPDSVTICQQQSGGGSYQVEDRDGDGLPAIYAENRRKETTVNSDGTTHETIENSGRCWIAGDADDDGEDRVPLAAPDGPDASVTVCQQQSGGGTYEVEDRDGDGLPAVYAENRRKETTINSDGTTQASTKRTGRCWIAGDADDDGIDHAAPTGAGDGFVAHFQFDVYPATQVGWDGSDMNVHVWAYQEDGAGTYQPYAGRLRLVVQRDCGGLEPVASVAADCGGTYDTIGGLIAPDLVSSDPADLYMGAPEYSFKVPREALNAAFGDAPAMSLHFFVQTDGGQSSHYLEPKEESAIAVTSLAGLAPLDQMEALTFTPVVVTNVVATANVGDDEASVPASMGSLEAAFGWFKRLF